MNVEEIRAYRIAEAERMKNMTREEIIADTKKRAKPMWDKLKQIKQERIKTK